MRLFLIMAALGFSNLQAVPPAQMPGGAQTERVSCEEFENSKLPKFKVVREYPTDVMPGIVLRVLLDPADVSRDKLLALACSLGRAHAEHNLLFVYFFDSKAAAKNYSPMNPTQRALYGFSRNAGSVPGQSLDWRPDASDRNRWIHIDMGPSPPLPTKRER